MSKATEHTRKNHADLVGLGVRLNQQIEAEYALWAKVEALRAPLRKAQNKARKLVGDKKWADLEAARDKFEASPQGKKYLAAWSEYNLSARLTHKLAKAILRRKPKTITGFAVFAIAAIFAKDWAGYTAYPDGQAALLIVAALCKAADFRIPKPMRAFIRAK